MSTNDSAGGRDGHSVAVDRASGPSTAGLLSPLLDKLEAAVKHQVRTMDEWGAAQGMVTRARGDGAVPEEMARRARVAFAKATAAMHDVGDLRAEILLAVHRLMLQTSLPLPLVCSLCDEEIAREVDEARASDAADYASAIGSGRAAS